MYLKLFPFFFLKVRICMMNFYYCHCFVIIVLFHQCQVKQSCLMDILVWVTLLNVASFTFFFHLCFQKCTSLFAKCNWLVDLLFFQMTITICCHQDVFVKVRKRDLERLTTEVMQLREFLPRVLSRDLTETLRRALTAQTCESPTSMSPHCLTQYHVKTLNKFWVCMSCVWPSSEGATGAGARAPASGVSAPAVPALCVSGRVSEGERGERQVDNVALG